MQITPLRNLIPCQQTCHMIEPTIFGHDCLVPKLVYLAQTAYTHPTESDHNFTRNDGVWTYDKI